jgi:hypothetical protein
LPLGVRNGQTLIVNDGGVVGDNFNSGLGSTVLVTGGQLGANFEAVGAQVIISGGSVGNFFVAFDGSTVNISGGTIGSFFEAHDGSTVNISGGVFDRFFSYHGSTVNISGGMLGDRFDAFDGSTVNISGGTVGDRFTALNGSSVNLFGTEFVLDGIDITASLITNVPLAITDRDITLSGLFADGSPFSFDLNSTITGEDLFDPLALLSVTLVRPGDFDGNLVVDGADFLKWQRGQSPDPLSASDLAAWETNYGMVATLSATSTAVPEPATWIGLMLGMMTMLFRR